VEVFERDIKKSYPGVVWNTGIPATWNQPCTLYNKKIPATSKI